MAKKSERIIGFDILRICSMCGIVGLHIINNGGLIENANISSISYYVILLFLVLFYTSVDIFGLLSGYLNIHKKANKNSRIVELLFILLFYCLIIPIVFYVFNIRNIRNVHSAKIIIANFFPVLVGRYWYFMSYILLFFMIPYINFFCKIINKKTYKKFLLILFVFFTIIPNFFGMTDFFKILDGYSPFWLVYCYLLGGYVKLYGINLDIKRIVKDIFVLLLIEFTINVIIRNISFLIFNVIVKGEWFINYVSPFTLMISMLLLLLFKNINTKSLKVVKLIIYLSSMSFSVYIIHCHKMIFDYILKDLFVPVLNYSFVVVFIIIIVSIVIIYLLCCFIDEFRKLIFKVLGVDKLINRIGKKLDVLLSL